MSLNLIADAQNEAILQGYVTDISGDTLPYAHVFSNTSLQGTSTNENGKYILKLNEGIHEIIVQYVGYENAERTFQLKAGERRTWNVQLNPRNVELQEVVVKGGRNPGNEIIRQVINKRKQLLAASENYEAEVYIKGLYRIHDAPEKFLGRETGGIDSLLSELPSNIIYLSETHSVFTKYNGKEKELIKASRTSGMSSLPSINNAALLDLNFYENHPELIGKPIKSPIADDAFQHYRYRLKGVYQYEDGQNVFRIHFTPKRKVDPLLEGNIEILDQQWMIRSLEAHCKGTDLNIELADSIHIKQIFHPVKGTSVWPVLQTEIFMELSALGFQASGGFTGIFNHYTFDPDLFTNEISRVQLEYDSAALEKDSSFWNKSRPIELTGEEKRDYQFKDSVANEMNDPELLDSLAKEGNRFQPFDLILGYEYNNLNKRFQFNFTSPLNYIGFNPVQGFNTFSEIGFQKLWGKRKSYLEMEMISQIGYGLSDQTWRYKSHLSFQFDEYDPLWISISGGQSLLQVNNDNPISLNANEFSNLFFKNHYIRFYESRRAALSVSKDWEQGFSLLNALIYERRSLVENTTQYSIFLKDRMYQENIPDHTDIIDGTLPYEENRVLKLESTLSYKPGISYIVLPNSRITIPSELPEFTLHADWGIPAQGYISDYLRLEGRINYDMEMGISGTSRWVAKGGGFLWKEKLSFFDYKHFSGNQFFWGDANYTENFMVLPYYEFSTDHPYVEFHWTHNFDGYLLNKVPLIRQLGFSLVSKIAYLSHRDIGHYNEISLGLDRLGWGIFRLLRVDVTASFQNLEYRDWGIIVGSRFKLSNFQ